MATISLSLSSKHDKVTNKSEILIRFVGGRDCIFRYKSGFYISPERWNTKDSKVIIPRLATPEQRTLVKLQSGLDQLCNKIIESFTTADKTSVNKSWLELEVDKFHFPNKYNKKPEDPKYSLVVLFDKFIDERKLSDVRRKNFRVISRIIQRFQLYHQATEDENFELTFEAITPDILRKLEKFLRSEHELCAKPKYKIIYDTFPEKRTPQPRGQNTINDIFTKFRTFLIWSNENGYTSNNPFKKFHIEECVYGTPYYITIEERNQIYAKKLSERPQLEIQRDIFVFQCLIGCRVGDLYKMTKANVINGVLEYIPRKTKDDRPITVRVPLNQTALEILNRYSEFESDMLLPFISEQKYNVAIKTFFKLAEITRIVTIVNPTTGEEEKKPINEIASSHLARRTFVGNLYKKVKDPNLVGALSGHKEGSKAFARYRNIDDDMRKDLISLLD